MIINLKIITTILDLWRSPMVGGPVSIVFVSYWFYGSHTPHLISITVPLSDLQSHKLYIGDKGWEEGCPNLSLKGWQCRAITMMVWFSVKHSPSSISILSECSCSARYSCNIYHVCWGFLWHKTFQVNWITDVKNISDNQWEGRLYLRCEGTGERNECDDNMMGLMLVGLISNLHLTGCMLS